ncbi:unnamed protein product [Mucor fragilis]
MILTVSADISELFEDTLEKNRGVLDTVVSNQLAGSVVQAIPASVPQQAQPASNRLTDAQIAAINQQLASTAQAAAAANYPHAVPASYPQAIPASYPQVLPANYPQAVPASYRPVTPQNVQYIPYPVASKHDDDDEEEDEEEEDEEEEDEEEFDADDLVTRRRRR